MATPNGLIGLGIVAGLTGFWQSFLVDGSVLRGYSKSHLSHREPLLLLEVVGADVWPQNPPKYSVSAFLNGMFRILLLTGVRFVSQYYLKLGSKQEQILFSYMMSSLITLIPWLGLEISRRFKVKPDLHLFFQGIV